MAGSDRQIEIIARGVLFQGSRVLLCRNIRAGYYYLPGGHVEFGEPATKALEREFKEECGLSVAAGKCVLVSEGCFKTGIKEHHEINLVFHVEQAGGGDPSQPIKSNEPDIAFEWVEVAAVLETDLRPLSVKAWLTTCGTAASGVEWLSEMGEQPGPI